MTQETFSDFIRECGYEPPERIEPGRWISFSANGKRGNTAGRCKLFPDGEGGIVYDWRTGESQTWHAKRHTERSPEDARRWREKLERNRCEAAEDREREAEATRKRARELWDQGKPADDSHPYLVAKGVKCHGLRIYRGPLALNHMRCDGALMVPRRDAAGQIVSLQFIAPDGEKRYLHGPTPSGSYYSIGKPNGTVCVAEGYATGATVHEATGNAVAIAFDAGGLEPTAKVIRAKLPDARLILCADDDHCTKRPDGSPWNPGVDAARRAAQAVAGALAIPAFGLDRQADQTDFNDLHQAHGVQAVRAAIDAAQEPPQEAPQEARRASDASQDQPRAENGAKHVLASLTEPIALLRRGDEVQTRPITWLMPDFLPCGKFVLIGGQPGTGKTTTAIAFAAAVSCGGRFPDDSRPDAGDVIVWSGEDSIEDTLAGRFKAAGANMSRVHFVAGVDAGLAEPRYFDPAQDVKALRVAVDRLQATTPGFCLRLVIVDPIVSAVQGDSHKGNEVRRALQPLVDFADAIGAVVLGVTHFSKGTQGREPIERITGSIAFAALARVILVCAKLDDADGGGRVMVRSKNNLGPDGGGFKYDLGTVEVEPGVIASRVLWGEAIQGTAREILATVEDTQDATERGETQGAAEWLKATLANGELTKLQVMERGREAGFSERTLQRARNRLGVKAEQTGFGTEKRSIWRLPDGGSGEPSTPQSCQVVPIHANRKAGTNWHEWRSTSPGGTNGAAVEVLDRPPWEEREEAPEADREAL
jgi:putative DNA primase/helicase